VILPDYLHRNGFTGAAIDLCCVECTMQVGENRRGGDNSPIHPGKNKPRPGPDKLQLETRGTWVLDFKRHQLEHWPAA